jgi:hypothetical protein
MTASNSQSRSDAGAGQDGQRKKGPSRYQRQMGHSRSSNYSGGTASAATTDEQANLLAAQKRRERQALGDQIDQMGGLEIVKLKPGDPSRRGWLYHIQATTVSEL